MEYARNPLVNPQQFMNDVLARNGKLGQSSCEIMAAAINAVDPYQIIREMVKLSEGVLIMEQEAIPLNNIERIFIIGFGKAAAPMAKALLDILDEKICTADVVTKSERFLEGVGYNKKLNIYLGGHPIPTESSVQSTKAVLEKLCDLTSNDLVLVAISGGGSALFSDPIPGISLNDLQIMTDLLVRSGADINEVNTLRKHLDQVKGGRLAERLFPAKVRTLILSDVVGDRLDMIASGPTVSDPTTFEDALHIIEKYDLHEGLPESIRQKLALGYRGELKESLKSKDFQELDVKNYIVGSNIKAARAAKEKAELLGYNSLIITSHLTGRTRNVAETLGAICQTEMDYAQPMKRPACLIFGGETTVAVQGGGKGGRNQDLALHMVRRVSEMPGVLFISLATDGEDGPTDAAGAACDAKVYHEGAAVAGLSVDTYIDTNNAYNYFESLGGLIKIGSTGTNVNDLIFIMIND